MTPADAGWTPLPIPSRILFVADAAHWDDLPAACGRAAAAGIRWIEVRRSGPEPGSGERLREVERAVAAAWRADVVVNDRVDLAALARAAGAHVGQGDLPATLARRVLGPEALLGLSTHDREQLAASRGLPLDYVALGPIFDSPTKSGHAPVVGLAQLEAWRAASSLPLVAIGGITPERVASVLDAGADAVAIASGLRDAGTGSLEARADRALEAAAGRPSLLPARAPVLVAGLPGAGKSAVGSALARAMDAGFVDLDDRVDPAGGPAAAFLERRGEAAFRREEARALASLLRSALAGPGRTVIALGGGTLLDPVSRSLARRAGRVLWLDVPWTECLRRLAASPAPGGRPLLDAARGAGEGAVEALGRDRSAGRSEAALVVDGTGDPATVACLAMAALEARNCLS